MVQEGLSVLMGPLFNIFRSFSAMGYTLVASKKIKVMFIPKPVFIPNSFSRGIANV